MKNLSLLGSRIAVKLIALVLVLSVLCAFSISCGAKKSDVIKIGATPVPHAEILDHLMPMFEAQGLKVEVVEFTDYVTPNLALADGELFANFFQHRPYMDSFAAEHGVKLASVGSVHVEPFGLYSTKIASLADLKSGDSIGIPNDPSNGARSLLLLQSAGLIKLKDPNDLLATEADVVYNPLKLRFIPMDAAQLPRTLEDVAASTINTNFALEAGLNPKHAIVIEGKDSPYANILTVRSGEEGSEVAQKLIQVLQSPELLKFLDDTYKGAVSPAF